jgi:hypothetical protein
VEGGRTVIVPLQAARDDIVALLAGITDKARNSPTVTGKPMGRTACKSRTSIGRNPTHRAI